MTLGFILTARNRVILVAILVIIGEIVIVIIVLFLFLFRIAKTEFRQFGI